MRCGDKVSPRSTSQRKTTAEIRQLFVNTSLVDFRSLTVKKTDSTGSMIVHQISFTETNGRIAESAERDQTAFMCKLILLYTLRIMSL